MLIYTALKEIQYSVTTQMQKRVHFNTQTFCRESWKSGHLFLFSGSKGINDNLDSYLFHVFGNILKLFILIKLNDFF